MTLPVRSAKVQVPVPRFGVTFAAILGKGAHMLTSFAQFWRAALVAGLGAALVTSATQTQAQTASSPFVGYAGSWSGGGKISMVDGRVERLRCNARYYVKEGGALLVQSFDCVSDTYKFELKNQIEAIESDIHGNWYEVTHQAQGSITGRMRGDHIDGTVSGLGFTATFSFYEHGNRQQLLIGAQGGDVAQVTTELTRSR
jgi:hypothetical protein